MGNFYCRVETADGKYHWGYRKAPTTDLALACFIQDEGILEKDVRTSWSMAPDKILVSRLMEFISPDFDPWGCTHVPFTLHSLTQVGSNPADLKNYSAHIPNDTFMAEEGGITNHLWHAARIRWLINNFEYLKDPISIDNQCNRGYVYPIPIILDGWHRLFAFRFLGAKRIPAFYGGRVDLLNYLAGKRKTAPQE